MEFRGRVGILGGTFDPIHLGHVALAEAAVSKYDLDTVILMPSDSPYYKEKNITAFEHRFNMTKLAAKGHEKFYVSDFENINDTDGYTYDILVLFKRQNPLAEVFFIIGGDSLFSIESWKNVSEIFSMCTILVSKRTGESSGQKGNLSVSQSAIENQGRIEYTLDEELDAQIAYLKNKYNAVILNIYAKSFDAASSEIRKMVAEGEDISGLTDISVEDYIKKNNLYI